jgi:hypothetical protein
MRFNGSKLWTSRRELEAFLRTQNHRNQYEEFEGSYTPAASFFRITAQTSSYIPGGIGMFLSMKGVWGITGMSIGGKKSGRKLPHSELSHANAVFC